MIKISLSFMLLRLRDTRPWRTGLYTLMISQLVVAVTLLLLDLFRCQPIRAAWDFSIPRDRCIKYFNVKTSIYISSSESLHFNISIGERDCRHLRQAAYFLATDIIYSCLPIVIISKLQRPLLERILICFLMALGFFAAAAIIPKIIKTKKYGFLSDATFLSSDILLWTLLEVYIGVIAACIPTLRRPLESALRGMGLLPNCDAETKNLEFRIPNEEPGNMPGMANDLENGPI
jgi:hypothetical protein